MLGFQFSLAYLADLFEALNKLNLKLHEGSTTILSHYDALQDVYDRITTGEFV
jgi:hypothetical protein